MAEPNREVEIKLAVATAAEARARLERAGFRESRPRAFESNAVFDTPALELRRSRRLLRLRLFAGEATLTYKGPPQPGPHKSREEIETGVADAARTRQLLEQLGYQVLFCYEKYRTTFEREGEAGHAVVDETPIGVFVELEGAGAWIDKTAQELGFGADAYIRESYGTLYLLYCESRGLAPGEMVFPEETP